MKEYYKYENDKILVGDTKKKILEYEYRDNIDELLKQENIIEELSNTIVSLENKRKFIESIKDDFKYMVINDDNYGFTNILFLVMGAFCTVTLGMLPNRIGLEISPMIFKIGSVSFLLSIIPTMCVQYKCFKRDNNLKIINMNQQIREFEDLLCNEKQKLLQLRRDKSVKREIDIVESNMYIYNEEIDTLIALEERKKLYAFYRAYCGKIQKLNKNNQLNNMFNNTSFTENDISSICEMSKDANKMLVKSKSKKRKFQVNL